MKTFALVVLLALRASAATYYVDPAGSNGNNGLSPQSAWRTLLKVGISTFQPGDVILFKRDAIWNEWLTPPSSGAIGNLIKFDAYGNGRPPEFTGYYATTSSQRTNTSGNVWQITLSAAQPISQLKFVRFGTKWGNSQSTQGALGHDRDWFYDPASQNLFVWSATGNPVTHCSSVTPIILSGQTLSISTASATFKSSILSWIGTTVMESRYKAQAITSGWPIFSRTVACRMPPCQLASMFIPTGLPAIFTYLTPTLTGIMWGTILMAPQPRSSSSIAALTRIALMG